MKILFVGGGNMASALIGGLLKRGASADQIRVVEIDANARTRLQTSFDVAATADYDDVATAELILLAVKPQQMHEVARTIKGKLGEQLIVTIAAGIRTDTLATWLGGYMRIVRVMPNTPALVLAGISGMYAMPTVSATDRERAAQLMRSVGEIVWLPQESDLDAVTGVSGSGPAYVFYFIEALQAAARARGLSEETARALALHTFAGAARQALESAEPAAELRRKVTSKGGTTERGIEQLQQLGVFDAIDKAVLAATDRSHELGKLLDQTEQAKS